MCEWLMQLVSKTNNGFKSLFEGSNPSLCAKLKNANKLKL